MVQLKWRLSWLRKTSLIDKLREAENVRTEMRLQSSWEVCSKPWSASKIGTGPYSETISISSGTKFHGTDKIEMR